MARHGSAWHGKARFFNSEGVNCMIDLSDSHETAKTGNVDDRPIFMRSVETQAMIDCLMDAEEGDVVLNGDLSNAAGMNVQSSRGRGRLKTAKRYMLTQHRRRFETVMNVGQKRLSDAECVAASDTDIKRCSRKLRQSKTRLILGVANIKNLSPLVLQKYNANRSLMEISQHIASQKAKEKALPMFQQNSRPAVETVLKAIFEAKNDG
jgi:hypothetical protein